PKPPGQSATSPNEPSHSWASPTRLTLWELDQALTLLWAGGSFPDNTRVLRGAYTLAWRQYTQLEGSSGEFRCLAVFITPSAAQPQWPHEA
ncbi:hypothetical protein PV620_32565, partial [Streptomyces sp. ME02-6978a]|nr:hypothetical protein [Streptomyces sp. ME12-02E]MDX3336276.1 hypothetical protein [Streptomyces sp. ME02-6978a]